MPDHANTSMLSRNRVLAALVLRAVRTQACDAESAELNGHEAPRVPDRDVLCNRPELEPAVRIELTTP